LKELRPSLIIMVRGRYIGAKTSSHAQFEWTPVIKVAKATVNHPAVLDNFGVFRPAKEGGLFPVFFEN
jgi:hypothetical protein